MMGQRDLLSIFLIMACAFVQLESKPLLVSEGDTESGGESMSLITEGPMPRSESESPVKVGSDLVVNEDSSEEQQDSSSEICSNVMMTHGGSEDNIEAIDRVRKESSGEVNHEAGEFGGGDRAKRGADHKPNADETEVSEQGSEREAAISGPSQHVVTQQCGMPDWHHHANGQESPDHSSHSEATTLGGSTQRVVLQSDGTPDWHHHANGQEALDHSSLGDSAMSGDSSAQRVVLQTCGMPDWHHHANGQEEVHSHAHSNAETPASGSASHQGPSNQAPDHDHPTNLQEIPAHSASHTEATAGGTAGGSYTPGHPDFHHHSNREEDLAAHESRLRVMASGISYTPGHPDFHHHDDEQTASENSNPHPNPSLQETASQEGMERRKRSPDHHLDICKGARGGSGSYHQRQPLHYLQESDHKQLNQSNHQL